MLYIVIKVIFLVTLCIIVLESEEMAHILTTLQSFVFKGSSGIEPNLYGVDPGYRRQPKQKIIKNLAKEEVLYQKLVLSLIFENVFF